MQAHLKAGDVLVAISTNGNSGNIVKAIATSKNLGASVIGVTGKGGGKMKECCDVTFIAPSDDTPRIQEAHLFFGHCFCELVEQAFLD